MWFSQRITNIICSTSWHLYNNVILSREYAKIFPRSEKHITLPFGRVICLADMGNILAYNLDKTTLLYRCHEVEHMILVKRWENHINIYATVVGKAGICMSDPYESSEDDIPNSMYDLILHLYQFDVKLTSLCFGMCLFVLNRTIVIFYTDLTIWIVHLRWPHMCVYPLAMSMLRNGAYYIN